MSNASQLIASQYRNGEINRRIWSDLLINVKSYGAKGRGLTNDTAAVQEAINAAEADGGGIVVFPGGTYLISKIILKTNVHLIGQGKISILKRIDSPDQLHLIIGDSVHNFSINQLYLDVSKSTAHSFPYTDGINLFNCGAFSIKDVFVKNSINRGVYIEKNTDSVSLDRSIVTNCIINGSNSAAVVLKNCSDLVFNGNTIEDNVDSGLVVEYTTATMYDENELSIASNRIVNNGQMGIWCYSDASDRNIPISTLHITENVVSNNGFNGIITQINESILLNNIVKNNGSSGTLIGTGITANTTKTTISGGSISGNDGSGIDLGDCKDVIVQGVRIEDNGVMGIEVNSSEEIIIDSCILKGNNTTNDGVPFGSNNGIYVYQGTDGQGNPFPSNSKNVQIKNCIVRGGTYQAIGIRVGVTAEKVILTGNDVYNSGTDGDFKIETAQCIMDNNISEGNGHDGNTLVAVTDLKIPPDGDVFFLTASSAVTIATISTAENILPTGRKITLVLTTTNITLFAGDGSNGNLINNGNASINGSYKIVEYICLGGSFPVWQQLTASAGR